MSVFVFRLCVLMSVRNCCCSDIFVWILFRGLWVSRCFFVMMVIWLYSDFMSFIIWFDSIIVLLLFMKECRIWWIVLLEIGLIVLRGLLRMSSWGVWMSVYVSLIFFCMLVE